MEEAEAPFVHSQHFVEALEGPAKVTRAKVLPPPMVASSLSAGKSQRPWERRLGKTSCPVPLLFWKSAAEEE